MPYNRAKLKMREYETIKHFVSNLFVKNAAKSRYGINLGTCFHTYKLLPMWILNVNWESKVTPNNLTSCIELGCTSSFMVKIQFFGTLLKIIN